MFVFQCYISETVAHLLTDYQQGRVMFMYVCSSFLCSHVAMRLLARFQQLNRLKLNEVRPPPRGNHGGIETLNTLVVLGYNDEGRC